MVRAIRNWRLLVGNVLGVGVLVCVNHLDRAPVLIVARILLWGLRVYIQWVLGLMVHRRPILRTLLLLVHRIVHCLPVASLRNSVSWRN